MRPHDPDWDRIDADQPRPDGDFERRVDLLMRRLPPRIQGTIRWLRRPGVRWIRIAAGLLLIVGGFLSILPVFGLWMLPLGLLLLAEDIRPLRNWAGRILAWIEHRRPHWMGLPEAPPRPTACSEGERS